MLQWIFWVSKYRSDCSWQCFDIHPLPSCGHYEWGVRFRTMVTLWEGWGSLGAGSTPAIITGYISSDRRLPCYRPCCTNEESKTTGQTTKAFPISVSSLHTQDTGERIDSIDSYFMTITGQEWRWFDFGNHTSDPRHQHWVARTPQSTGNCCYNH